MYRLKCKLENMCTMTCIIASVIIERKCACNCIGKNKKGYKPSEGEFCVW